MTADAHGRWAIPHRYDFNETTRLLRTGVGDPTIQRAPDGLWRTAHTSEGPVTVRLTVGTELEADAWGPGAAAVMADIPRWVGLTEAPWQLPAHPVVDRLRRDHGGVRGTDTRDVFEALVVVVLHQLVTWQEAALGWRHLCELFGDRAPGPRELRMSPTPRAIRAAGTARLRAARIGFRHARTLVEVASVAHALQRAADLPTEEAAALMQHVRGVGPWTTATVLGARLGRPDPIPLGDFHLPDTIAWALAGEPRGTDARMLELLEPFRGQAFRVIRLVRAARIQAPRRGPRRAWAGPWRP